MVIRSIIVDGFHADAVFVFHLAVVVNDAAYVNPFLAVVLGVETALETVDDDTFEVARGQAEVVDGQFQLTAYGGARHQAVVGAERGRQLEFLHLPERVVGQRRQVGICIHVRREADLDREARLGDVLAEVAHVAGAIADRGVVDEFLVGQVITVTDAVGMQQVDGLKDRLGTIGLAGVHGLLHEVAVDVVVGFDVVLGRIAMLGSGQVEAHDRQGRAVADRHHRPGQFGTGQSVLVAWRRELVNLDHLCVVRAELFVEHAHRACDQTVFEGGRATAATHQRFIELLLGAHEAIVDGIEHTFQIEVLGGVQHRCKAHLQVADALFDVVTSQFVGDSFQRFWVLEDGTGVLKALEIFFEVGVAILENQLAQALLGLRGQLDVLLLGQLDQSRQPQAAIEVHVEIGLGDVPNKSFRDHGFVLSYWLGLFISAAAQNAALGP